MIAGKDQHIFRIVPVHKGDILVDGVGRAGIPFSSAAGYIGREHENAAAVPVQVPGLPGSDIGVELHGLILSQHAHGIDIGINAVGKGEIDDAIPPAKGYGWLCHAVGENAKSAALSPGQQHGYHFFLDHGSSLPPVFVATRLPRFRLGLGLGRGCAFR